MMRPLQPMLHSGLENGTAKLGLFQVNAQGVLTRHLVSKCSLGYRDAVIEADKPVVQKILYQSGNVFVVVTDGSTDQIGGSTGKTSFGYGDFNSVPRQIIGLPNVGCPFAYVKTNCSHTRRTTDEKL